MTPEPPNLSRLIIEVHQEWRKRTARRGSPIFTFTRALRSKLDETTTIDQVWPTLARIVSRCGGWPLNFPGVADERDAFAAISEAWERIRYREGAGPLENALVKAVAKPLGVPRGDRAPGFNEFISLCAWLQVTVGNKPICLPCKKIAELLGVAPITISTWRRWAVLDNYLVQVREHAFRKAGTLTRATEFRFDVSRWDLLSQKAAPGCALAFRDPETRGYDHDGRPSDRR